MLLLTLILICLTDGLEPKTNVDMQTPPSTTKDPRFRPGKYETMVILVPFGKSNVRFL